MSDDNTIYTRDDSFVDADGNRLLLRGVNLSGASKAPIGHPSQRLDGFWEDAESGIVNFDGRPLNLDDGSADVHLERLRGWGYNMLRYPVCWEALEHEGPRIYDEDFINYTIRVLRRCKAYGFKVFLDPHQDIWSRFCGGSGAPYWTLLACGMNPRNFTKTTSALLHAEYNKPEEYPAMIWSTNYTRLAAQTLFTLFFAGRRYAPKCIIDGMNIQDYLQSHFIEAFGRLADRIREMAPELYDDCIIGWDSMNEPSEGLVGWMDLETYPVVYTNSLWKGTRPTPAQSLRLGMGRRQEVDIWDFGSFGPKKQGTQIVDPEGAIIWADAEFLCEDEMGVNSKYGWRRELCWKTGTCIWGLHDVWNVDTGDILKPMYFAPRKPEPDMGENIAHRDEEFEAAHWKPHVVAYMKRIHTSHPKAIAFLQPPVFAPPPDNMDCERNFNGRVCYSPHYYDGMTLITRHWHWYNADALGLLRGKYRSKLAAVKIGETSIRRSFRDQLGYYKNDVATKLGPYPTLIGEIGIPYDMDKGKAYGYTDGGIFKGDYSSQIKALDASLSGADGPDSINYTVWNYCPDNSHKWGDQWNREDLSIWSPDDLGLDSSGIRIRRKLHKRLSNVPSTPPAGDRYPPTHAAINSRAALMENSFPSEVNVGNHQMGQSMLSLNTIPSTPISRSGSQIRLNTTSSMPNSSTSSSGMSNEHELPNAYAFLNSGARASKAFCRPWPVSTAGRVSTMDFDIRKAELKMSIFVTASSVSRNLNRDVDDSQPNKGRPVNEVMSEIYVPLVHYASDDVVLDSFLAKDVPRPEQAIVDLPDSSSPVTTQPKHYEHSPLAPKQTSGSSASTHSIESSPVSTLAPGLSSQPRPKYPINSSDFALDVTLSTGRYELHGQYLRWFYPLPEKDEHSVEQTITIRRKGGMISESMVKRTALQSGRINESELIPVRGECAGGICDWVSTMSKNCVVM